MKVTIEVPEVGYKAVGESDAQRYEEIARRVERDHHVGGSNSRAAVAELLRRIADALPASTAKDGE